MDFYLARNDSLRMLRWARRQKGVCLLAHAVAGEPGLKMGRPSRADLLRLGEKLPRGGRRIARRSRMSPLWRAGGQEPVLARARDAKFRRARPSGVP